MLKQGFIYLLRAIVPVAIIAGAFGAYSYLKSTKPPVHQREAREKVWPVRAVPVKFSDHQPDLRLYGETIAGRRVELRALVSGKVIETGPGLKEGQTVAEGEFLLRIDPFDYEGAVTEAEATLAEAEAKYAEYQTLITSETQSLERAKEQLQLAERDLERATSLTKRGTISEQVADQRQLTVSQRKQAVEQSTNNLALQQARAKQQEAAITRLKWKLKEARRNLMDTKLTAPFSAYILSVGAEQGRLVGASDRVVTLLDKNWIDVSFTLSDKQYGRILAAEGSLIGREIDVNWFVGDKPLAYQATIERVKAEIASENGGVTVIAHIHDPETPSPIRPGAFVEVHVPDRNYTEVARIPRTALYTHNKVYAVKDERLSERGVEVVGYAGNDILVRGDIKEGEQVITTRLSEAGEGVKVRVLKANGQTDSIEINKQKEKGTPESASKRKDKPGREAERSGLMMKTAPVRHKERSWSPLSPATAEASPASKESR